MVFIMLGILGASWICILVSVLNFGNLLAIITSSIFSDIREWCMPLYISYVYVYTKDTYIFILFEIVLQFLMFREGGKLMGFFLFFFSVCIFV